MKKILLTTILALVLVFTSCDIYEDEPIYIQVSAVSEVVNPNQYAKDSITEIPVKYKLPSQCHVFRQFYYEAHDFNRLVAIESLKTGNNTCPQDEELRTAVLRFKPTSLGTYHFKFWLGEDAQGVDQFIEFDAVVDH